MRVALIGWGAIAQTVAELVADVEGVEIVAVATRSPEPRSDLPEGARHITDPADLAEVGVDVVAEAAGRDSVAQWGRSALAAGADFIVSSVSAFADPTLLDTLRSTAAEHQARLEIQPGALAGVDALAAARYLGIDAVEHRIVKPPRAWLGTLAESLCPLDDLTQAQVFFSANAAETAQTFPNNANVAMTTALAGVGPSATTITLVADPATNTNRHEITAHGAFGELAVSIANQPLATNPKTSAMAALALARTIANRTSTLVI